MTTLEVVESAESQAAVAYLLNLVLKRLDCLAAVLFLEQIQQWQNCSHLLFFVIRVPVPVLRSKFSDTSKALLDIMSKEATSETPSALRWVGN